MEYRNWIERKFKKHLKMPPVYFGWNPPNQAYTLYFTDGTEVSCLLDYDKEQITVITDTLTVT